MKIFIGQRVWGEDREKLIEETEKLVSLLKNKGHEAIYVINYPEPYTHSSRKEKLCKYAFKRIDESDIFLAIVRSKEKSEGMLMEIGHILDKNKKIILAIQKGIDNTKLNEVVDQILEFDDFDDLLSKLKNTDLDI